MSDDQILPATDNSETPPVASVPDPASEEAGHQSGPDKESELTTEDLPEPPELRGV